MRTVLSRPGFAGMTRSRARIKRTTPGWRAAIFAIVAAGVNADATDTLIQRNTANGSGHDGISVDAKATTLIHNTANRNHGLGIEAVFGVTDGGGNHAFGNGNPAQCVNVACSR
jgi:parallel beta-helix repeat protein